MIEILCGPISCGKSTYAHNRAKDGAIVINDDAIVKMLHGGDYTLYDSTLKPLYKSIENHIITHAVAVGLNVIIDRTNHLKSTRARYVSIAKSLDEDVKLVLFDWGVAPEISANRRFTSDSRGLSLDIWLAVANRHKQEYESPTLAEGYQELIEYDDSPYCDECGACGEPMCCPPTRCKYFMSYLKEHNV